MADIDNDINQALWRAAYAGDSEAVAHALDQNKLLRCVERRQYKNKMTRISIYNRQDSQR